MKLIYEAEFIDEIDFSKHTEKETKEEFIKNFDSIEYLKTYYGEKEYSIKITNIFEVLRAMRDQLNKYKDEDEVKIINVGQVVKDARLKPEEIEDLEEINIYEFQRKVVMDLLKVYPGDKIKMLDVGSGPTIYQNIIMCLVTNDITHSEFLEKNRNEVIKWLNNEQSSFNWDAYFVLIKEMLQKDDEYKNILDDQLKNENEDVRSHAQKIQDILQSEGIEEFKKHLRQTLKDKVTSGDIFDPDLGLPKNQNYDVVQSSNHSETLDLITSNFAVESATGNKQDWEKGMTNIIGKVKPNGYLALTIIRNAKWYKVGNNRLPATPVNEEIVRSFLINNGCEIKYCQVLIGLDKGKFGYDGTVMVFAKKIDKNK